MINTILLFVLTVGIITLFFRTKPSSGIDVTKIEDIAKLKSEIGQKDQEIGKLQNQLREETSRKDEAAGKAKQLFAQVTQSEAERKNVNQEKERLTKELSILKAEENRIKQDTDKRIEKLDEAKNALEDEKKRIRKEDEERENNEKLERDRMWAEHEDKVKVQLFELCKMPQFNFATYDNKNLPDDFGGRLKPDFMIEFLGQYIIFDAKASRSDNFQNYVSTNVKSTVEKISGNSKVYPTVFFVVPSEAISSLTKTYFYEQSYEFHVITPDVIPAILSTFKKISAYELAEQMDPRDRDNVVNLIAEFDYHINFRNALDILSAQSGVNVLSKVKNLKDDFKGEIIRKKNEMRLPTYAPTEIKTLVISMKEQEERISELTAPRAQISSDI